MTTKARFLLGSWLLVCAAGVSADTVYVTDILQLAMHEKQNSKGRLLRSLASGTQLQLLERTGYYAKVRTLDGMEGWTKAAFLVTDKPARSRLAELVSQGEALGLELKKARRKLSIAEQEVAELRDRADRATEEAGGHRERLFFLEEENKRFRERLATKQLSIPFPWFAGAAGGSLLLGFIGGFAWFDYRSRRRHGGYRIY